MSLFLICALSCQSITPAIPQEVAVRVEDVIVIGRRGAARVPPEIQLDPDQIDSLGAYDIGEAIARIGDGLGLDRPPVLIINGRRVVNPGDFLGFPPDALERVEVLPQQASAIYGGDPSQRVVNLVLKPSFRSRDGQSVAARPTAGGKTTLRLDARQSSIAGSNISQYGVRLSRDTALRGAERPTYIEDNPGREGVTLRPAQDAVSANIAIRRELGDWSGSISANAQTQTERSAALIQDQIIDSRRQTDTASLSGGLSGQMAGWAVRLGLEGQVASLGQDGVTSLRSSNLSTAANLGADRTVMELPAGPLIANLTGRYGRFVSTVGDDAGETSRSVDTLDLGGNLAIPLTRSQPASEGRKAWWGDTSITLGATLRETDGASGRAINAGVFWSPLRKLRLNGQWSTTTESPTAQQRLGPVLFGEPRIVFDFTTGQAVEVLTLLGGNPDLRPPTSDLLSAAVSAGPFTSWNVLAGLNFQSVRATDGIGGLPTLTPEVEAVFPDRFQRDEDGRLIVIDQRPVNLDSTRLDSLSSNLNFNLPFGSASSGGRGAGTTLQVALNHTWQLANVLSIRDDLSDLDRLAGDGGGVSRHQVAIQLNGRHAQWGLNAAARWRSASRIRRNIGSDGTDDVRMSPFATFDLKLSYLFQPRGPSKPDASRSGGDLRLELEVDNLFDARPEARLGDGRPAPGYGRDDQDPLGRVVRLSASRRF